MPVTIVRRYKNNRISGAHIRPDRIQKRSGMYICGHPIDKPRTPIYSDKSAHSPNDDLIDKNETEKRAIVDFCRSRDLPADRTELAEKALGIFLEDIRSEHPTLLQLILDYAPGPISWASKVRPSSGEHESAPQVAPKLWEGKRGRRSAEDADMPNPVQFILDVYRPWLDKGFERHHLRNLDYKLYNAAAQHARRYPDSLPLELKDFFVDDRAKRSREELKAHDISSPKDAFRRGLDYFTADSLYKKAKRHL